MPLLSKISLARRDWFIIWNRFAHAQSLNYMRGSRNFRQGGGGGGVQVNLTKKADIFFFFSPQLVLQISQMVNFKENYHFSRFQRGSNIFQGGGGGSNCLFPLETHITCDFPGGSEPPVPPSVSNMKFPTM